MAAPTNYLARDIQYMARNLFCYAAVLTNYRVRVNMAVNLFCYAAAPTKYCARDNTAGNSFCYAAAPTNYCARDITSGNLCGNAQNYLSLG
jgi:hypothetical protein